MSAKPSNIEALEKGPILPLLLQYSLPAIAGLVVMSLYNIIDSIFIGHWIGAKGLAGTAIAFPVMNLGAAVGTLVGIGGGVATSIFLGQKCFFDARRVLGQVFVLAFLTGIFVSSLALFFLEDILRLFGASEEILPYAYDFMFPQLLGQTLTYYFFNLNHVMRASGYPVKAMCSLLISAVFNVVLAPLFLYWGWGIQGVAWATVISQFLGAIWVTAHFLNKNHIVFFSRGIYALKWSLVRHICFVGLPPSVMNMVGCLVIIIINWQLKLHGGDTAIAANGIFNRCVMLNAFCVIGISQGAQPIIGFNYGANKVERVRKTLFGALVLGAFIATSFGLFCVAFPRTVAACFTQDEILLDVGAEAMRWGTLALPLVGFQIIIVHFFQSIGKAHLSVMLSFTRQAFFLIPALLVFPRFWNTMGVWLAFPFADFIASVLAISLILWFLAGYKTSNHADLVKQKLLSADKNDENA